MKAASRNDILERLEAEHGVPRDAPGVTLSLANVRDTIIATNELIGAA